MSSVLEELLQKKKAAGLRPTTTKITHVDGSVHYSSGTGTGGGGEVVKSEEKTHGFVVDLKPDLSVGQVLNWLFVSGQDVPCDARIMKTFGITHVLSLLPGFGLPEEVGGSVKQLSLEFYDEDGFDLKGNFGKCLEFLSKVKREGGKVLVHCNAGISRAPAVVIAYLRRGEGLSFEEAWEKVKEARPGMKPNVGFVKQLKEL